MPFRLDQRLAGSKFQEWNAFLNAASCDSEEIASVGFGETAVAFRNIGGNGERCSAELVAQEEIAAREFTRDGANRVGEGDGLLVDE